MDLLSMMTQAMTTDNAVGSLSGQNGVTKGQASGLVTAALPILLQAMTSNAASSSGANSLLGALNQHQTSIPIEDQIKDADKDDGGKIIGHILGGNATGIISQLASQNNMSNAQASSLLAQIAPALLAGVGAAALGGAKKKKKPAVDLSDGLDIKDVIGFAGMMSGAGSAKKESDGSALLGILSGLMK